MKWVCYIETASLIWDERTITLLKALRYWNSQRRALLTAESLKMYCCPPFWNISFKLISTIVCDNARRRLCSICSIPYILYSCLYSESTINIGTLIMDFYGKLYLKKTPLLLTSEPPTVRYYRWVYALHCVLDEGSNIAPFNGLLHWITITLWLKSVPAAVLPMNMFSVLNFYFFYNQLQIILKFYTNLNPKKRKPQ